MSSDRASEIASKLEISASRQFVDWLVQQNASIAFSTYQAAKLFLVGVKPDGRLSIFERTFSRCMGLWSDGEALWLASEFQLWRLQNILVAGQQVDGYDRLYVPRAGYTTGDLDVHDVAVEADGRVVFVNTRFSCLATVDEKYNFQPLWRPPFISKIAAEDRCHLNGLALADGRARYMTACGQSDIVDGWRDGQAGGGCVLDVQANEIVAGGLSMPHSPRVHADRLWLLDSGSGYFGLVDTASGEFEHVAFCPGYARGLAFLGDYAIVGISKCRRERTFSGLPLDDNLATRKAEPRCGLFVVDLRTGDLVHWFRVEGIIDELYDVAVLPGARRPKALGFKTNEIKHQVWIEESGLPTRWARQDQE